MKQANNTIPKITLTDGLIKWLIILFGRKTYDDQHLRVYNIGRFVAYRYQREIK